MAIKSIVCDLCGRDIPPTGEIEMIFVEKRQEMPQNKSDICESCYNRLRTYIRHGLPKISEIEKHNEEFKPGVCPVVMSEATKPLDQLRPGASEPLLMPNGPWNWRDNIYGPI